MNKITLIVQSVAVSLCTARFHIWKSYLALALHWAFSTYFRMDSHFRFIRHLHIGFYNRGGKCLLCGTDWFHI